MYQRCEDRCSDSVLLRINSANTGQFERTLIIVDEGASINYVEGCTAPTYSSDSLHAAVVEVFVKKDGYCRYDDPKLVKQCLQFGNQTWTSPRKRDNGMGRRQLRLKSNHEIPKCLHGRQRRPRYDAIDCRSRQEYRANNGARMIHNAPNTSSSIVSNPSLKTAAR